MANAVITNDRTPTLDWADVAGALEYWAQISADPRFTTIEHQQAGLATSTITVSSNLTDAKKYYWRFRTRTSATLSTDRSNTTASGAGSAVRDAAARTILAQSFTPGKSLPLKRIILSLKRTGTVVGNVWVEIWATSGGAPSAQSGTDSATVAVSTIGTAAFENVNFDFTTPVPLVAGTVYAITLHGDFAIDGVNYATWEDDGSGAYSGGSAFKADGSSAWSANGTDDMVFTTQTHSWGAWSQIWSFWLDSSMLTTVTPTAWTLVDPDEIADAYTFAVQPAYGGSELQVLRGNERNILGDLLTEYTTIRSRVEMSFDDAYVHYAQASEIMRFYHKRKSVFLIVLDYNGQDTRENVYKVEFEQEPVFEPLGHGREDYHRGEVIVAEAALT